MNAHLTYSTWQTERHQYLTSPTGNLALIDYLPLTERSWIPVFDAWAMRVDDGIILDAPQDVTVDGAPVTGPVYVPRLQADGTGIIQRGSYSADVFTLDGSAYELRVYDATATRLADFEGIDYYPFHADWVIPAHFAAYDQPDAVAWDFTRSTDTGSAKKVPGIVHLTVAGQDYELVAFLDGDALVLTFADGTTGAESYAPGRFLRLPAPDETGALVVDFNRSFIPPCGFSDFYSCPLPPASNRIKTPIRAGERAIKWLPTAA